MMWDDLDYMIEEMKPKPYDWELSGDFPPPEYEYKEEQWIMKNLDDLKEIYVTNNFVVGENDLNNFYSPHAHIRGLQEKIREEGMCGAVFIDDVGEESICIRDPHNGDHKEFSGAKSAESEKK